MLRNDHFRSVDLTTATPAEMRKAINRAARSNFLVRRNEDHAYVNGLSGEDKMTVLAFLALLQVEQLEEQVLDTLFKTNPTMFVAKPEDIR